MTPKPRFDLIPPEHVHLVACPKCGRQHESTVGKVVCPCGQVILIHGPKRGTK
ncbi:MAG TPA: hypothetical protein VGQ24_09710 [Gemmatimonadales bacterium]|jgi:hypothetical protein|nr:hypothetical protein [Gemmatimonadales bacterium]